MERGVSRQLAAGVVESLLDLTRSTGARLGRRDDEQLVLLQRFIDRFWEELAVALESGPALERSQELVCALLEEVKRTYLGQLSRAGVGGLIEELDLIMVREGLAGGELTPPAPPQA
jgi:pantothenate synthetase